MENENKVTVAQYKSTYGTLLVLECSQYTDKEDSGYIRVSEPMEVEFTPLDRDEIVKKEIAVIDKQIQTVQAAASVKLDELEQRKAELLALPDLSEQ